MIREVKREELSACADLIRKSFQTVADEFGFTRENAPRFTAFATTEERLAWHMDGEHRLMYLDEEDGRLRGYYSLLLRDKSECELGSLSVLPEYRHHGIGGRLLRHAMKTAAEHGCAVMNLSIVEENTVLRKWYERFGAVHTGAEKFDFFPFTCGYLERDLRESPIRIENLMLSRGHIILWLEKKMLEEKTEVSFPRFVYISGELALNGKFYADMDRERYWVEKPAESVYFPEDLSILGTVTDEEILQIIIAANERNKSDQKNVQIIFEPISSVRVIRIYEQNSQ